MTIFYQSGSRLWFLSSRLFEIKILCFRKIKSINLLKIDAFYQYIYGFFRSRSRVISKGVGVFQRFQWLLFQQSVSLLISKSYEILILRYFPTIAVTSFKINVNFLTLKIKTPNFFARPLFSGKALLKFCLTLFIKNQEKPFKHSHSHTPLTL